MAAETLDYFTAKYFTFTKLGLNFCKSYFVKFI